MLYVVFSLFLLGLLPHLFSIPHIGSGGDIVTMMIPFLLGTSFLALAVSRWFTDSEAPLLMIASSLWAISSFRACPIRWS